MTGMPATASVGGTTFVNNPVTDAPIALWRPACTVIGLFFGFAGLRGVVDPVGGARFFGLKAAGKAEASFYPGLAGRNVSMGIAVLAYIATGERRALGIFLCSFAFSAITDLYLVLTAPAVPGALILAHAAKTVIIPAAGMKLLDYW